MEQSRAINALAPFLALSKSATSPRAAADLVTQATSAHNTYVFAELLQTPAIQALRNDTQYAAHYTLLEIFAWGTWEDYQTAASTLPSLTATQTHKLRLLTLLTLASRCADPSQLTYTNLQNALSLSTPLDLEQLVISAIYANLLQGTLNPAQQTVVISSVAPLRDLAPGSAGAMVAELDKWSTRCEGVLADLEAEIATVRTQAAKRAKKESERASQMGRAERAAENASGSTGGAGPKGLGRTGAGGGKMDMPGAFGNDDAMDVDGGGGGSLAGLGTGLGGAGSKRSKGLFGSKKK